MQVLPRDVSHSLRSLDGYRAVAALAVLTTHVAFNTGVVRDAYVGAVMSRMDFGVCLFFVLSGFLLYRPWAQSALEDGQWPDVRVYAVRRTLRILPAYLVMAVFTLALLPEIQPVPTAVWLQYLSLTQIYASPIQVEGLVQVWSLATELSFYLALPILAWALGRRWRGNVERSFRRQAWLLVIVALVAAAVSVLRGWGVLSDPRWAWVLPSYLDWFAIGMFLALVRAAARHSPTPRIVRQLHQLAADVPTCLIAAACLYAIACTPVAGPLTPGGDAAIYSLGGPWTASLKHWLYALCAGFLLLPAFLGASGRSRWLRGMSSRPMVFLGTISYGIFLWHLVILRLLLELSGTRVFSGGFWWIWPSTVVLSVLAATVSWFAIERPCQSWSHRFRPAHESATMPEPRPQPRSAV